MDDAERRSGKRSRFDQTQPEPRKSRFDRRSRSPPSRRPDMGRERSPISRDGDRESSEGAKKPVTDPAAAAAAAAARISANFQAKKGIQHVSVPPIQGSSSTSDDRSGSATINTEMYVADGDYIKDIEINDMRNRYVVTNGARQQMIKSETGADVTTRGSYYPDKSMATPANPPLYLHITSTTKRGLEMAVAKIEELMSQELPALVDERRFRRKEQEQVERDEFGRRKWPEEKIPISLDPLPGFNLRAQVVGQGGAYVKYIQQETACRVQIKGRGSGYLEYSTNREADEDMFLHVTGPDPKMVERAKELCVELLENVQEQYEDFKTRPPRNSGADRAYGDRGGDRAYGERGGDRAGERGGDRGGDRFGDRGGDRFGDRGADRYGDRHGDRQSNSYGGYGNQGSANSPVATTQSTSPTTAAAPATAADYAAQYAQYYGQDPYAAYGGYAAYVAYYQQYYAAQAGQQQGTAGAPGAGAPGASSTPPPPPPSEQPPPPPPPSSSAPPPPPGTSSYGAVPPPPGL